MPSGGDFRVEFLVISEFLMNIDSEIASFDEGRVWVTAPGLI